MLSIVPPKTNWTYRRRTAQEIRHDGLCGLVIGIVIGLMGWWVTDKVILFAALPLCILFCVLFGLMLGSTNGNVIQNRSCPWVIW